VTKRATPLAIKIAHQGDFPHKIGVLGALPLNRLQREAQGASFAYLATQKFMLCKTKTVALVQVPYKTPLLI
jgi:hypothetical protein